MLTVHCTCDMEALCILQADSAWWLHRPNPRIQLSCSYLSPLAPQERSISNFWQWVMVVLGIFVGEAWAGLRNPLLLIAEGEESRRTAVLSQKVVHRQHLAGATPPAEASDLESQLPCPSSAS